MGYGTSLGTAHEDEMSYTLEKGIADKSEKKLSDTIEINQNTRSGDFQSRFYATDASTMPLEVSRKLTDALKQSAGMETPEKVLETNYVDKLREGNTKTLDFLFGKGENDIRPALGHALETAKNAFALPGDVLSGKVQAGSVQEIERAADLAMMMVGGPAPVATKMADGTLGSFAGVKSRTLPKDKLYEAQNMELDMMHPDDIWDKTGFFRGADRRWRYEIPDIDAKLKPDAFDKTTAIENNPTGWTSTKNHGEVTETIVPKTNPKDFFGGTQATYKPLTLNKVLDHPELFKAYPELATLKVAPFPESFKGSTVGMLHGDTIYLAPGNPEYVRGILLHEIQHGIQHHEGFAYGGNKSQFLSDNFPAAETILKNVIKETYDVFKKEGIPLDERGIYKHQLSIENELRGEVSNYDKAYIDRAKKLGIYDRLKNIVKSKQLLDKHEEEAYTKYQRLMGEVEARNVEARKNYDWRARQIMEPSRTEDVARYLQTNPKADKP